MTEEFKRKKILINVNLVDLMILHKMEIAQTCTSTWQWCMGMFGTRFAVFVRRARVLPGPCPATRNLSFLGFHHLLCQTRCSRTGTKYALDYNQKK